jgi:hypothetical protein
LYDWRAHREQKAEPHVQVSEQESLAAVDADLEAHIQLYTQTATSLHAGLPVAGFATQLKVAIDIEDIYVPWKSCSPRPFVNRQCGTNGASSSSVTRVRARPPT